MTLNLKDALVEKQKECAEYLERCRESVTDAEGRLALVERLLVETDTMTAEHAAYVADLLLLGIVEESRPF